MVAPPSFGRFGGELIAADENSGRIYAFGRDGTVDRSPTRGSRRAAT